MWGSGHSFAVIAVVVIVDTVGITAVVVAVVFATKRNHQQEYLFYPLVSLGISYAIFRQVAYNIVFPGAYYTKDLDLICRDARRFE